MIECDLNYFAHINSSITQNHIVIISDEVTFSGQDVPNEVHHLWMYTNVKTRLPICNQLQT